MDQSLTRITLSNWNVLRKKKQKQNVRSNRQTGDLLCLLKYSGFITFIKYFCLEKFQKWTRDINWNKNIPFDPPCIAEWYVWNSQQLKSWSILNVQLVPKWEDFARVCFVSYALSAVRGCFATYGFFIILLFVNTILVTEEMVIVFLSYKYHFFVWWIPLAERTYKSFHFLWHSLSFVFRTDQPTIFSRFPFSFS